MIDFQINIFIVTKITICCFYATAAAADDDVDADCVVDDDE